VGAGPGAPLRKGGFAHLDIEHIADEIEDVGKAEQRELASRTAVLLARPLKWRFQPQLRTKSWRDTFDIQRQSMARRIHNTEPQGDASRFRMAGRHPDRRAEGCHF
jgi:hypothetical protein